jgi:hypothetical protein
MMNDDDEKKMTEWLGVGEYAPCTLFQVAGGTIVTGQGTRRELVAIGSSFKIFNLGPFADNGFGWIERRRGTSPILSIADDQDDPKAIIIRTKYGSYYRIVYD